MKDQDLSKLDNSQLQALIYRLRGDNSALAKRLRKKAERQLNKR